MNDIHKLVPRLHTSHLISLLQHHPLVILHGARQTGKTTLARTPPIGQDRTYLTLDDFEVAEIARRDPAALFIGHDRITLDEVQRQPDLLLAVKIDVDRHRIPERFLLTGSANLLLMEKIAESLAGRAVDCLLPPLTWPDQDAFVQAEFLQSL